MEGNESQKIFYSMKSDKLGFIFKVDFLGSKFQIIKINTTPISVM